MDETRQLSATRKCEGPLPSFEELIGNLSGRRPTEHCGDLSSVGSVSLYWASTEIMVSGSIPVLAKKCMIGEMWVSPFTGVNQRPGLGICFWSRFRCDMNCIINFTKHEKVAILRNFANKSKDEIDNHLYSLIEKREKPKFTYHALKGEERHVVCRKAFISLHNTSTKAVYRLTKLLEKDQVPEDSRGKHGHQRSPRPQWVNDMMHHHMLYCVSLQDIG
uniref:(California timema) hypothetical protein n=1 Tax=Timema californicum TaxID=61474 RepID=A0A7R9JH49_TIMCA|nr:unnamed protein product [Timema californicum]